MARPAGRRGAAGADRAVKEAAGLVNLFQFNVFRVSVVEEASSINVAELVVNMPRFRSKHNNGYGDNVGDGQVVPSSGLVYDPDTVDMPALGPGPAGPAPVALPPFGPPAAGL